MRAACRRRSAAAHRPAASALRKLATPAERPSQNLFRNLERQTGANAPIDAKELFGGLATRPSDRPPDPENESPGTVGTATGAEVQTNVLQRTSSSYPKIVGHTNFTTAVRQDAPPLRIVIEPTESRRKWSARLGDRVLCRSASPFVMSARMLLHEGYPPDALVEVWRRNVDAWAMRGRLVAVAATLIDGETASRRAKNGVPVRFPGMAVTTPAVTRMHATSRLPVR